MVAFDPAALIQDLMKKKQTLNPMVGRQADRVPINQGTLDPQDRAQQRQGYFMQKADVIDDYAPEFESDDKYLDMAEEMMFRANQINQKAAMLRANRQVQFNGGPEPVSNGTLGHGGSYTNSYGPGGTPVANGRFGNFLRAIAGKESGGSYSAVNPDSGAMGKYQIIPSNIAGPGGWDMEILGRNISTQAFLNNPRLQEKIARGKLRQYYNRYGVRGAASAWYSGDPNKWRNSSPQGGYPSINAYVMDILRRMGLA